MKHRRQPDQHSLPKLMMGLYPVAPHGKDIGSKRIDARAKPSADTWYLIVIIFMTCALCMLAR